MELYKFNKEAISFEPYPYRKWLLSIGVGFLIFASLGFIGGLGFTPVPDEVKEIKYIVKDSIIYSVDVDYGQIVSLESGGRDSVVSKEGAIGHMQIMPIALAEWNKNHPHEQYKKKDLFNREVNVKIGRWLLSHQIPLYLTQDSIPIKMNHKLIVYNWGIGNFLKWYKEGQNYSKLPEETRNYLLKYWKKF